MSDTDPQHASPSPAPAAAAGGIPEPDRGREEKPPSPLGRLLAEISWEGNAKPYRQGGRGLENVLTTEVFQALDFLPRTGFLGRVVRSAEGAAEARRILASQIEEAAIELLPGDIALSRKGAGMEPLRLQPDGIVRTPGVHCLVEAKRIRSGAFQPQQLAREYLGLLRHSEGRHPLLLLVLPKAPPVSVRGHGRLPIDEAIARWIAPELSQLDAEFPGADELIGRIDSVVAYVTWSAVSECVAAGLEELSCPDPSVSASVFRLAQSLRRAVEWHS